MTASYIGGWLNYLASPVINAAKTRIRQHCLKERQNFNLVSNEEGIKQTHAQLENLSVPQNGVIVAVGTFSALDIVSVYGKNKGEIAHKLYCVDIDKTAQEFLNEFLKLFRKHTPSCIQECLVLTEVILRFSHLPGRQLTCNLYRLLESIESGESWLSCDERFERVKQLILDNKISILPTDITLPEAVEALCTQIKQNNEQITLSSLSNVREYQEDSVYDFQNYADSVGIQLLHNPELIVLDTRLIKGGISSQSHAISLLRRRVTLCSLEQAPFHLIQRSPLAVLKLSSQAQRVQTLASCELVKKAQYLSSTEMTTMLDLIATMRCENPQWNPDKVTVLTDNFANIYLLDILTSVVESPIPLEQVQDLLKKKIIICCGDYGCGQDQLNSAVEIIRDERERFKQAVDQQETFCSSEKKWEALSTFIQEGKLEVIPLHFDLITEFFASQKEPQNLIWSKDLAELGLQGDVFAELDTPPEVIPIDESNEIQWV